MENEHPHDHQRADVGRAFAIGIGLNLAFLVAEAIFGVLAHSTALLADAAHNASDVLGLVVAWAAIALGRRKPSSRHTYGFRRATVLAALANAMLLLVAVGGVCWEAVGRLAHPDDVHGVMVMAVAAVGVGINGASAVAFWARRRDDVNVRGAFIHLAADAGVSLGVVVAGALIWKTGWTWLDPAASFAVSAVVLVGTWGLLKQSVHLALDGVPDQVNLDEVRAFLEALPAVEGIHDLHVWAMSTTEVALTAHLIMPWAQCPPDFLRLLARDLHDRFGIEHATVQIEPSGAPESCGLASQGGV
jgi:cobalt-zinc-cadmium efflux system protein